MLDLDKIVAIDIHTHAEVSCHDPEDPIMGQFFDAATTYFKAPRQRPTIPETIAYLSKLVRLEPGDLIYSGTPEGVAAVQKGDLLEGTVAGVGTITTRIV